MKIIIILNIGRMRDCKYPNSALSIVIKSISSFHILIILYDISLIH